MIEIKNYRKTSPVIEGALVPMAPTEDDWEVLMDFASHPSETFRDGVANYLVPLHYEDAAVQLGREGLATLRKQGAAAALLSMGHWEPVQLGEWITRDTAAPAIFWLESRAAFPYSDYREMITDEEINEIVDTIRSGEDIEKCRNLVRAAIGLRPNTTA